MRRVFEWALVIGFVVGPDYLVGQPTSQQLPFSVSKHTTYLVGPLKNNGQPNLMAIINNRHQDLTLANNAAVKP